MRRAVLSPIIIGLFWLTALAHGDLGVAGAADGTSHGPDPNAVDAVLDKLAARAADLKSYQCKVDYLFKQVLLESQSRRKGALYYARFDDHSYLRIDFNTLQQNDEKEQKAREQFLFDGVWLTYVDYELKSVERRQMAEPNEPVDAFTLVSRHVPMVGFSQIGELQKQFEIELVEPGPSQSLPHHLLHMKVKPGSVYRNDYTTIDFWVDKKNDLPTRIVAVDAEQDIHEIAMTDARINGTVRRGVFDIDIPADFSVASVPLKRGGTAR
jgi:outer membrane lipoprotein-sorting protein